MKTLLKAFLIIFFLIIFFGFVLNFSSREEFVEPEKETKVLSDTVDLTASVKLQQITFTVYPEKREPATGNWDSIVDFLVRDQTTDTLYFQTSVPTNASGVGSIVLLPSENVTNGNHAVYIKGHSHLTGKYSNTPFGQQYETLDFTPFGDLRAGDTHSSSDDLINALDVSVLIGNLNSGDYRNDLNQDSLVNSLDISNQVFNFAESGDV